MQDSFHMLNWFWWQNRITILLMLVSVLLAQSAFFFGGNATLDSWQPFLLMISIAVACLSAITVFSFGANLDLTSGRSSFPNWLYNLPVASSRLALIPILAMIAALAWGWIPAANAFGHFWRNQSGPDMAPSNYNFLVLPWCGLSAFGLWLQAIAWWPFRSAWSRLGCLGMLVFVLSLLIAFGRELHLGVWFPTIAIMTSMATGFLAAIFSATKARHLAWRSEADGPGIMRLTTAANPDAKLSDFIARSFRSPISAMAWRDWKQLGRAPFILILMICAPMALLVATLPSSFYLLVTLSFIPAVLLVFVGPMLGKSRYWKDNYELSTFLSGLPISDNQFVKSRFGNTIRTACVLWASVMAVSLIWLIRQENRQALLGLVDGYATLETVNNGWSAIWVLLTVTLYLAIIAPWPGLALGMYGRKWLKRIVPLACFVSGLSVFIYACTEADGTMVQLSNPETRGAVLASLASGARNSLAIALGLKFIVGVGLLAYACRLQTTPNSNAEPVRLIESKQLLTWGPIMLGLSIAAAAFFCWMLVPFGLASRDIVMVVVLTFPFGAIVACRLAFDCNRHR